MPRMSSGIFFGPKRSIMTTPIRTRWIGSRSPMVAYSGLRGEGRDCRGSIFAFTRDRAAGIERRAMSAPISAMTITAMAVTNRCVGIKPHIGLGLLRALDFLDRLGGFGRRSFALFETL